MLSFPEIGVIVEKVLKNVFFRPRCGGIARFVGNTLLHVACCVPPTAIMRALNSLRERLEIPIATQNLVLFIFSEASTG